MEKQMKTDCQNKTFTVASLNLLNNNTHGLEENFINARMPRIIGFINSEKPDSIGVQECDFTRVSGNMRSTLNDGIFSSGYVCAQGEYWDGKYYAFKNFIWYNSNTTACTESGQMWLSETPEIPSKSFGKEHYISMCWAVLKNKATDFTYVHVNTHLYYKDSETRLKEVEILLKKIQNLKVAGYPVFLTGDMNEGMDGAVYARYMQALEDTRRLADTTTDLCTFHCFGTRSNVIDFCLCSIDHKVVHIDRFDVAERYEGKLLSDHNALLVDVSIKTNTWEE